MCCIDFSTVYLVGQQAREVAERLNLGEDIVNRCTILLQKKPLNGGYKVPWYCALVQIACDEDPEAKKTVHDFAVAIGHQIVKKVETPPLKPGEKGMFTATFNQAAIVKELIDDISLSSNTCRRARDAPQLAFLTTGEQAKDLLIKSEGGDITKEMLEEYFRQQLEEIHHKKCVAAISLHYDHLCYALDRASPIYFETEDLYKSYVQSGEAGEAYCEGSCQARTCKDQQGPQRETSGDRCNGKCHFRCRMALGRGEEAKVLVHQSAEKEPLDPGRNLLVRASPGFWASPMRRFEQRAQAAGLSFRCRATGFKLS
eukprot:symbB.v1.2.041417.t1/scaffold8179.1/size7413/1